MHVVTPAVVVRYTSSTRLVEVLSDKIDRLVLVVHVRYGAGCHQADQVPVSVFTSSLKNKTGFLRQTVHLYS